MENLHIITFTLIFALLFPIFSFGLSVYGDDFENYDISISEDSLIKAGIFLTRAESHNISYKEVDVQWNNLNYTVRADWVRSIGGRDVFQFWERDIFGTFLFASRIAVNIPRLGMTGQVIVDNQTIVDAWDTNYNWTKLQMKFRGYLIFFTPAEGHRNMTRAIYEDAKVTITIGIAIEEQSNVNFWTYINWYQGILSGAQTFGLPPVFIWLVRIISAVQIIAVIALIRELIKL